MFFDSAGNLLVNIASNTSSGTTPTSSSAALTSVPAATVSTPILPANTNRNATYITNNSSANMYLAYGPTASLSAFTVKIAPNSFFELPTTPVWQGALSAIWDSASGTAQVTEIYGGSGAATASSSAALTSVPAANSSTAILPVNPNRKGAYVANNGAANMYLAYGIIASTSAFTVKIPPNGFFELPVTPVWQGALSAIWDSASGTAQVTEVS